MTPRLDINVFCYRDDADVLSCCVMALAETFPEANIHLIDDIANPIPEDYMWGIICMSKRIAYRGSHFPRQGNLNGRDCILGMLDAYASSNQGETGYTMKVDPDTLIFGRGWYDDFIVSGLLCLGSPRPGSIMSGVCYVLRNDVIPQIRRIVRLADLDDRAAEDTIIGGAAVMLSSPRYLYQAPAQRKECPFGRWVGYNYSDWIKCPDLHLHYDVVTFGNYFLFGQDKAARVAPMVAALQGWMDYVPPTHGDAPAKRPLTFSRRPAANPSNQS